MFNYEKMTKDDPKTPSENASSSGEASPDVRYLRKLNHNIKNSLQVISSLLRMQSRQFQDPASLTLFKNAQCRVKPHVLAFEKVVSYNDSGFIEFLPYLKRVTNDVVSSCGGGQQIHVSMHCSRLPFMLDLGRAVPLAQITVELLLNALAHGKPGNDPAQTHTINISLEADESAAGPDGQHTGAFVMTFRDQGPGLAPDVDIKKAETFGFKMVNLLSSQLKADTQYSYDSGAVFRISVGTQSRH